MAEAQEESCEASTSLDESTNCLPLSSPALNDTINFILSGFLIGCQPVRCGCDLSEYLYNFKSMDDSQTLVTFHYTGSKAEGIERAADDDFMFVNHNFRVVNQSTSIIEEEKEVSYLIATDLHPGYVHLRRDNVKSGSNDFKLTENDGFLRSDVVKAFMLESDPEETENDDDFFGDLTEHGPALTDDAHNQDFVCALPCCEWPDIASEFASRPREFNQPSPEIIEKIVSRGCLYVGVGHPCSEDRGKEWRLSFSLAEKTLIRCWSDVKIKCYIAVKSLCKENLSAEPKVICSYFIKTAIFWLSERMPESSWDEERILECILVVIEELLYYTTSGTCPNYFVASNNMMDHLDFEQRKDAISILESMVSDLPLAILQSQLAADTFRSSGDFVTLYLVLKNSDSPSNAESQLAQVNSHNSLNHFQNNENYFESMHLTETLQEFKHFFFRRLESGKVDHFAKVILDDLPRVITDSSFQSVYEKLLFLSLGDSYHQMALSTCGSSAEQQQGLLAQAESWISKAGVLKHPSGFEDGGIHSSAVKCLFYYSNGDKKRATDLCNEECDKLYSDLSNLRNLCHWSCAVVITRKEAEHFSSIDSSFIAILAEGDLLFSPVSIILYIAIKCSRNEEQCCKFSKCFEDLQQWFPPQITYYEKELHKNHVSLRNILTQDGILQLQNLEIQ